MTEPIRNKVVAITGASSGIGAATARVLAQAGAKVVLGARRVERLESIAAEIERAGGQSKFFPLDVTRRESMQSFVESTVEAFGRVDVLVNNAGVMLISLLAEGKVDEWERMVDVNIKGVLHGIGAVLPVMKAQESGHLINVSSVAGHGVSPGTAVYSATKFAVRALSEGFRQEAGPKIRSTIISPGAVATELPDHITSALIKRATRGLYANAIGAEAIARAVLYAIEQPADVDINEIVIRPTAQP
jgi:NADP-dependent 3-hydroxy acid dehydrogenase YdfG